MPCVEMVAAVLMAGLGDIRRFFGCSGCRPVVRLRANSQVEFRLGDQHRKQLRCRRRPRWGSATPGGHIAGRGVRLHN